jgi:hypothetical protein
MGWNHRVIKEGDEADSWYAIHEVYYDRDSKDLVQGWTENPVRVIGDSLEDLRWTLEKMLESLDKPVIDNTNEE